MNNNTMNNNNNNDNDNTMNNTSNVSSSNSHLMVEAVLSTSAQKHQPGTSSALYKVAARNLREYHGVPSMTALKLEKTVALLGLAPRRMVVQGLAPQRLLQGGKSGSSQLVLPGESSDETGELVDKNLINNNNNNNNNNSSSSEDKEEGEDDSNSSHGDNDDKIDDNIGDYSGDDPEGDVKSFEADSHGNGKTSRPIHAALVAGGINLRPRETKPLLCALGVSPHRLVKLGLVKREAIRTMAGGRGGGRDQHLRTGGRGKRGVEGPRGPSCGPPRALGGPSSGCGPSRPMHGPHGPPHAHPSCGPTSGGGLSRPMRGPPRLFHGAGHHTMRLGEESGEEWGISAPMGPHGGPGHRGPHHPGGHLQGPPHGPGHNNMPTGRHGRGPPAGGKHGHGHDGGGLHGEEEVEGGDRLRGGRAHGPGHHGSSRRGGGMGRPRGPPHARADAYDCCGPSPGRGPSRPCMHGPPPRPFHGASLYAMHLEDSEEEGVFTSPGSHGGPGHRGPPHPGTGGMGGRSCGRPQGPPHGPVHGLFHGLFHEGASGAPPGTMAHPHHGSPSRGGCGMKQRDGRHGGGTGFCGRRCGGGGVALQHGRMAHLAHFDSRQQPQLEAY